MRRLTLLFLSLALALPLSARNIETNQRSSDTTARRLLAIVGATLIDVNSKTKIPDAVVIIEGNKITAAGPRAKVKPPSGAEVIDARGKFLIPGLIDTHTHSAYDGKDSWLSAHFLFNGVTTVLDTGSLPSVYELKRRVASGELEGPRMLVCGPMITGEPKTYPFSETVNSPDEARRAVDVRVAAGADFIKTHAQTAPGELRAAIDEAHKKGLRTISHTGKTNAMEAVLAGTNILTHLIGVADSAVPDPEKVRAAHASSFGAGWSASTLAWLDADQAKLELLIREMVSRRVFFSPTLSIHHTIAFRNDPDAFREAAATSNPPATVLKQWEGPARPPSDNTPLKKAWVEMQKFVKRFHDAGGILIVGTDTAWVFQAPGLSAHEEMRLMAELGVPAIETLRAGTINAARALGIDQEAGSIEAGKIADLVILDGDPIADINNTRRISRVIKGGAVYRRH